MIEGNDPKKHLRRFGAAWSLCRQGDGTPYWPDTQGPQDCNTCWIIRQQLKSANKIPWRYRIAAE